MIVMMLIILVMMTMTMMDDDDDGVPPIPLADSGIHCQTSSPLFNRSSAGHIVIVIIIVIIVIAIDHNCDHD